MKTIKLPCYGIVVETDEEGGGSIISDLHEDYSGCCNDPNNLREQEDEKKEIENYNIAMDAIESLILGHACAGIDITTPAYIEGIESAVQGCSDNM